jgi:hypothetical protein
MKEGFSKKSIVSVIGDDTEIGNIITEQVEFYNIDIKQAVFSQIISTYEIITDSIVFFSTDLAKEFKVGPDSLFYVENKSAFVKASDLQVGDKLVCPTGDSIEKIVSIEFLTPNDELDSSLLVLQHLNGEMGYFINGVLVKNNNNII